MKIETERLIIRELELSDLDDMLALHSDPEVHIYLGGETITDKDKLAGIIAEIQQQYKDYGAGRWAMVDKVTNEFVGWTGLEYVRNEINGHNHFYDLGYRLLKKYWGRGYATESAYASINYGFHELGIDEIYAMADVANVGSNKILRKVGLTYIETFDHHGVDHHWYLLQKSKFGKRES